MPAINIYVLAFGIALVAIAAAELFYPAAAFRLWRGWVSHNLFRLHGLVLVASGFPLTLFRGAMHGGVFALGFVIVLTAPFILIYPEKIRRMFETISLEMDEDGVRRVMYIEAFVRAAAGIFFITAALASR